MNFEQNFQPLDTESQEYQSLNITPLVDPISSLPEIEQPKRGIASVEKTKRDMSVSVPSTIPSKELQTDEVSITYSPKNKTLKTSFGAGGEKQTSIYPIKDIKIFYDNWVGSSQFINSKISDKLKQLDEEGEASKPASSSLRDYMAVANKAISSKAPESTDLVYNLLTDFTDIQTNEQTRNSFVTAHYAPSFYSSSDNLKKDYSNSEFKDVLTPKQYTGLKSLSYGKQGEYNYYVNILKDPKATDVDKNIAKLNLEKIGTSIDITASSKMFNDAVSGKLDKSFVDFGKDLFLASSDELPKLNEKIRQIEFENPYNSTVTKNLFQRAVDRGLAMGSSADILNISSNLAGIDVEKLASLQRWQNEARASKAFENFYENPSLENFSKNPLGILMELSIESLTAMYYHGSSRMAAGAATGASIGSAIPVFGTAAGATSGVIAGMGLTSLNLEYSSEILEGISSAGYDISSAEDLRKAFQDEKLMSELKSNGYKKGIPVALFDMLSMGVAGKLVKGATTVTSKLIRGAGELGIQMTTGAGGEAISQLVKSGKIYSPSDVLMEAMGELGTGGPEIVFGAMSRDAQNNNPVKKRDLAIVVDGLGLQNANDRIDVLIGSGQLTEEQGTNLKAEVQKSFEQMQKMPSQISTETKSRIMDLVDKRDGILSNSQNLDDVFKKEAQKQADAINEEILKIANDDINSQQKQKENATQESSRTQQESIPEGGIGQYQGTQEVQEQATTEADNRNRPVSSTQEVAFQKEAEPISTNINTAQVDNIAADMNALGGSSLEFKVDDAVRSTVKANTSDLISRPKNAVTPKVVKVSDFIGKPIMVTISDELTTGDVVNPATGNTISGLMGGIGFNYTPGNTNYAWAYTDEKTAIDTLNSAKEIYRRNPELYPDGIVPVAVVKMGTDAMKSNEALFRVLLDNVKTLPKSNLKNAYNELVKDIKYNLDRLESLNNKAKLTGGNKKNLEGYRKIYNDYLSKNKNIVDVISNIYELNIGIRPLVIERITAGDIGKFSLRADKSTSKALVNGLPKEDVKKIHIGWIAEGLRDPSIKNVPNRHIIGFVGIDAKAQNIEKSSHPNYPFALKGMGLGVVEDTVHLASVMPTAYGNAVKKITESVVKNESITPAKAVSRAMSSGLANAIFKGKNLVEQESNISQLIGFLNLSFPNVTFFTDQETFDDVISSPDVKKYVKNEEVVYGLTKDGDIYINPSLANVNTPIHEMGHIWVDYIQNMNQDLFNKGISLVEGTDEFEKAKSQLGDNVNARKEALAMLIGNKGETIVNAAQKSKFKEWLLGVWKYLQSQFPSLRNLKPSEIENITLEQFVGGALNDLFSGQAISSKPEEYINIGGPAQKMSDIVPSGEQLPEPTGGENIGVPETTKEGGIPEKKKYDWESFAKEGEKVGEEMIKTSTGRYVAKESMSSQIMEREKIIKEIKKATPSWLSQMINGIKVGMIDNQYNVLKLLESVGRSGQLVKSYLLTRNSASTTAMAMAEEAVNRIFGGLSKKNKYIFNGSKISEYALFNQIIGYQRVISIQKQMNETYQMMLDAYKNILQSPSGLDRTQYIKEYNRHKNRLIENRMIDEDGIYLDNKLYVEFSLGQVTASQAYNILQEIRENVGETEFDKLMNLSEEYSQYYNSMMKDRMEAGLISRDTYEYLSKFFYAPTRYISSILIDPILSIARPSVSYPVERNLKNKKLKGGSERLNVSDYEGLLRSTIYASEYSIAENRTTNRFYNLVDENKEAFDDAGIRIGTKYVMIEEENKIPQDDILDRNVKLISEGKKPVSRRGVESGQKLLSFNGIEKVNNNVADATGVTLFDNSGSKNTDAEIVVDNDGNRFYAIQIPLKEGEEYLKTYFNGQRKDLIVPKWFAEAWNNDNQKSSRGMTWLGHLTGATLLRIIATGIEPIFGVAQLIPDSISAYASTINERKYVPLLIDYPIFFTKIINSIKDIKSNSNDYIEAQKYGATTNFYNGGSVSFERGLLGEEDKSIEKIIEDFNVPGLKQYIIGSKKITETTEQMTKVALYKSIRDAKINEYIQKNGVEPTGIDLEDIKIESGAAARSTADFHRKGTIGSDLNKIIPYFNAAIQVQRSVLRSAKENKTKTLYYTMEFAAITAVIIANSIGEFDDDELKEKKRLAYSKWSNFDKENRIPLYFVESKNKFISVKLPSFLVPINAFVSKSIQRGIIEKGSKYSDVNFSKDMRDISLSIAEEFPILQLINWQKVASRNPAASAYAKIFYNRDIYRNEDVVAFEEKTKDYLEGAQAGERQASEISKKIGKAAKSFLLPEGISPKRLDAAVSSIPFENNPFTGVLIFATQFATKDKEAFEEKYGKDTIDKILSASGISQRFFKEGTKINQNLVDFSINEIKDRGEFKQQMVSRIVEQFDEMSKKMTRLEAYQALSKQFRDTEYPKLDPEQKQIARDWFTGEFKNMARNEVKDPMIKQVLGMATADAKLDAINETLKTIKTTDSSRVEFLRQLFDNGLMKSTETGKRLNQRGMKILNNGEENPFFEPEMGFIRDELLKYAEQKRSGQ